MSYITLCFFFILFCSGLPFVFFGGKKALMVVIFEYKTSTFSERLERQIAEYKGSLGPEHRQIKENAPKDFDPMIDSDEKTFKAVCLSYLGVIILVAYLIDNLGIVFNLIGAYSSCIMNFIFPGIFFLRSIDYAQSKQYDFKWKLSVVAYSLIGTSMFLLTNYYVVKGAISGDAGKKDAAVIKK